MSGRLASSSTLIGRVFLATIFLVQGLGKFMDPEGAANFVASKGLPAPLVVAVLGGTIELVGGALLVLGYKARWSALMLAVYLIPVTAIFHNPVGLSATEAMMQQVQVLKNLSIIGGLLALAGTGPGVLSLDDKNPRRRREDRISTWIAQTPSV